VACWLIICLYIWKSLKSLELNYTHVIACNWKLFGSITIFTFTVWTSCNPNIWQRQVLCQHWLFHLLGRCNKKCNCMPFFIASLHAGLILCWACVMCSHKPKYHTLILHPISCSGVRISLLGTSATMCLIVPAPDGRGWCVEQLVKWELAGETDVLCGCLSYGMVLLQPILNSLIHKYSETLIYCSWIHRSISVFPEQLLNYGNKTCINRSLIYRFIGQTF
jgi:hypothetical protein